MYKTLTNIATTQPTIASLGGFNDLVITLASGWTITGIDVDVQVSLPVAAATTGLVVGAYPSPDDIITAVGYGGHGYTAPPIPSHLDDPTLIWLGYPSNFSNTIVVPNTTASQYAETRSFHVRIRTQFRLPSEKDFYIQFGNMSGASVTPQLTWTFRLHYE